MQSKKTLLAIRIIVVSFLLSAASLFLWNRIGANHESKPPRVRSIAPDPEIAMKIKAEPELLRDMLLVPAEFMASEKMDQQPENGKLAAKVLKKMPEYLKQFDQLKKDAPETQIDFVFMTHFGGPESLNDELFLSSQRKVLSILEEGGYDIVGYEGSAQEKVSLDSLVSEMEERKLAEIMEADTRRSRDDIRAEFARQRPQVLAGMSKIAAHDAGISFTSKHPQARVMGIEDMELHRYCDSLIRYGKPGSAWAQKDGELMPLIARARTMIAAAKAAARMKRDGLKRGVIIIGSSHKPESLAISKIMLMKSDFYTTDKE